LQVSTQCNASAVDNGYPIREPIVPSIGKRRLDLPVQKNILTNYFCILSTDKFYL
jgi:exonuclease-1